MAGAAGSDPDAIATVESNRKFRFDDEVMSLTSATRLDMNLEYSVAPGPHWTYNGKTIRDFLRRDVW